MLRCGRYLFGALLGLLLSAAVAGAAEKTFTIAYDADPQTSDMQMTTEFYLIPLNCYDRLIECRTVKGQPQLVMIGTVPSFAWPLMSVRSGKGSVSRSLHLARSELCTATPSRMKERPAMPDRSRSPESASMSSVIKASPPSPRAT